MKKEQEKQSTETISDSQLENISGGIVFPQIKPEITCDNAKSESECLSHKECEWNDSHKNNKCFLKQLIPQ